MKLSNIEVKEKQKTKKKRKINIQKIFNLMSFTFILACCVFYGGRFLSLYLENNKNEDVKLLVDNIKENNKENTDFKNINGNYYFKGENPDNYIKYSNLIWRIIRINSDNTVTIVLDTPITAIAAGNSNTYVDTYINEWLNYNDKDHTGILEKNLNKVNNFLTYTNTCYDKIDNTKNITCKKKLDNTLITIPSLNDYVNTGGHEGFMNSGEYYYLINRTSENKMWYVDESGKIGTSDGTDIIGIKPVITIKKKVALIDGIGTQDNPYKIEMENGLFGSYVKLGNDIWRVYSVDWDDIKLSLNSHLTLNGNEVKYKYSTNGYYHNDTKQNSLAYYLKNTYLPTLSYNNLINEINYSNGIYSNVTNYDYKGTLNTTINTKVTILSLGDIFLNSENTNYFTNTGVSEDGNQMYVMRNNFEVYTKVSTSNLNVVPVISINKNLLTTGIGTIESPLEVSNE